MLKRVPLWPLQGVDPGLTCGDAVLDVKLPADSQTRAAIDMLRCDCHLHLAAPRAALLTPDTAASAHAPGCRG